MERNRVRMQKKETGKSGGRLTLRIFLSVLLILSAIFIKQNAPNLAGLGREALSAWTVSLPSL